MKNQQTTAILFRGLPGVGKTFISNAFAKKNNLIVLHKDDIHDAVAQHISDHDMISKISHDCLFKILESNKTTNSNIVIDFTFRKLEWINSFINWCGERSIRVVSILVVCSDRELWKSRFNKRADNPASNQLITDLDELEQHYGNLEIESIENEIIIDSVKPIDEILEMLEN
jgi:2-phosphoglycerate kinase